jgi:hypothetical protein
MPSGQPSLSAGYGHQVVANLQIDSGYISRWFITDERNKIAELVNPYIMLHEEKLSCPWPMLSLLETVVASGKPLLIVAEDVDGEFLPMLVANNQWGKLRAAAVAIPGLIDKRQAILDQIAEFTGAKVFSNVFGRRLESITLDWLGKAQKVIVERDRTQIYGGFGASTSDGGAVAIPAVARQTPQMACVTEAKSGLDRTEVPGRTRWTVPNKPGASGRKRAQATTAMIQAVEQGRLSFGMLQRMKQKELTALYPNAGRTLLAECREDALLELTALVGSRQKSDITPTNDK